MSGSWTPVQPVGERAALAVRLSQEQAVCRIRDHAVKGRGWRETPVAALESKAALPWWRRNDPYWNTRVFAARRNWTAGPGASQYGSSVIGDLVPDGQLEHHSRSRSRRDWEDMTAAAAGLAATDSYRSVVSVLRGAGLASEEQVAAIVGAGSAQACRQSAAPLLEAEVIEEAWHHAPGVAWPRIRCWQIRWAAGYQIWARTVLEEGLGPEVFACMRPSLSARSDRHRARAARHQCLSVEAALRAMETGERWAGWLPEAACRPEWFLPPGHKFLKDKPDSKLIADGCLIRDDGARIFLEIEAGAPDENRLKEKIQGWSEMFAGGPFGAALLFIAAAHPASVGPAAQTIRRAVAEHAAPKARQRILVGAWTDHSPDYGLLTPDAGTLRAGRLAGRAGTAWQECHAADVEADGAEAGIAGRVSNLAFAPPWAASPAPDPEPGGQE